jgi:hypothetical protein
MASNTSLAITTPEKFLIIKNTIIQKAEPIGFDEFMNLALYYPAKGYYSGTLIQAELSDLQALKTLANTIKQLDVLVNNASVFYPTSMQNANENDWNTIINDPLWKCYKLHGFLMGVGHEYQQC